jgi:signal transduction histidine kinase
MQGLQRTNADLWHACVDLEQRNDEMAQTYRDLEAANQRLREMDRLTSGFIGTIDDELRTPFANLRFSLQLIEHYGVDGWSIDQRDQLAQLKEGIEQATQIVDSLVTFATLLGNADSLQMQDVDAAEMIETALRPLRPLAAKKELDLCTEIPAAIPPIKGDRERLVDAVYHLVRDAIQFTGLGGKVRVRCRAKPGAVQFEVEDSGVGASPERFEPLWNGITQMGSSLHRAIEGPGLGLAVVHLVVRAHGGRVYAESEEGKGSIFGFCIPLDGVDTTQAGPLPPEPEASGQR